MSVVNLTSQNTRHFIIDMQRVFHEQTLWHVPAFGEILPNVLSLAKVFEGRNYFAKFMCPPTAEHAAGDWKTFYKRWSMLTTEQMDVGLLDLVSPLIEVVEPSRVIEKTTYSVFQVAGLSDQLVAEGVDTLVFSGVETDICVLGSVLDAVDAGFHVVLAVDAMCSSAPASHDAILTHLIPRMPEQIEVITTAEITNLALREKSAAPTSAGWLRSR